MERKSWLKVLGVFGAGAVATAFFFKSAPPHSLAILRGAQLWDLGLAILFFLFYLLCEGATFRDLLRVQGEKVSLSRSTGYALADVFFSNISPGGSAGQPGQFFYMARDGIAPATCMMSLTVFNLFYHLAMVGLVLLGLLLGHGSRMMAVGAMGWLVPLGTMAQILFILFQGGLCFAPRIFTRLVLSLYHRLVKVRLFSRLKKKEAMLYEQIDLFRRAGEELRSHPRMMVTSGLGALGVLVFLYATTAFVARSLGVKDLGFFDLILIQAILRIAVESLPLPGSVGASEASLIAVGSLYMGPDRAFGWMFLSRLVSFYLGLFLGAVAVAFMRRRRVPTRKASSLRGWCRNMGSSMLARLPKGARVMRGPLVRRATLLAPRRKIEGKGCVLSWEG